MKKSKKEFYSKLIGTVSSEIDEHCIEYDELTLTVAKDKLLSLCLKLRDDEALAFDLLIDVCGIDYAAFGQDEWENSAEVTARGFNRGRTVASLISENELSVPARYAIAYHLLSISNNIRVRLKVFTSEHQLVVPSVTEIWPSANWFERETFDMFGIVFDGHPDLRRLLTDYGFVGHPLRKDFPLIGKVEARYDHEQQRVVYEPVSIEPRVLVPKIIRNEWCDAKAPVSYTEKKQETING